MSIILFKGHEWEPGEPCKRCGKRKDEILREPEISCTGKKVPPAAIIIAAALLAEQLLEQVILAMAL
jgi:hypothetical protein